MDYEILHFTKINRSVRGPEEYIVIIDPDDVEGDEEEPRPGYKLAGKHDANIDEGHMLPINRTLIVDG